MIFQIFALHSSMLKSIKSNNSPGHSHNRLPSVVDLSIDSCPGIILKRNNKMNNIISETTRPNGIKVQLGDYENPDGRITFIVKSFYSDGSKRDCKFFGIFNSAASCYNRIVEQENAEAEAK